MSTVPPARSWPVMPGVPAAGHVTASGWWHPGPGGAGCLKCHPYDPPKRPHPKRDNPG